MKSRPSHTAITSKGRVNIYSSDSGYTLTLFLISQSRFGMRSLSTDSSYDYISCINFSLFHLKEPTNKNRSKPQIRRVRSVSHNGRAIIVTDTEILLRRLALKKYRRNLSIFTQPDNSCHASRRESVHDLGISDRIIIGERWKAKPTVYSAVYIRLSLADRRNTKRCQTLILAGQKIR